MKCCLGTGDLLRVAGGAQGVVLYCQQGTLWLTKGDGMDYLVHAGGSMSLAPGAAALVEALGAAEFRLSAPQGAGLTRPALALNACRAAG